MKLIFILLFTLTSTVVLAAKQEKVPTKEADRPLLDDAHQSLEIGIKSLANRLDSFFAEKRADDELNRSSMRLSASYLLQEREKPKDDYQIRLNLRLPNLEKLVRVDFNNDKENKKPLVGPVLPKKTDDEPWRFNSDAGVNVGIPLQVFARGRVRKNFTGFGLIHRFSEEIGWYSDDGWLSTTLLQSDYRLSEHWLFRFTNQKDWQITNKDFVITQGPSLLHDISDDGAISYNARAFTRVVSQTPYLDNWNLAITYRHNLYKQWLFGEVTPSLDFPKKYSFRRHPAIMFRLETLFGAR